jgi:hypothetical protein
MHPAAPTDNGAFDPCARGNALSPRAVRRLVAATGLRARNVSCYVPGGSPCTEGLHGVGAVIEIKRILYPGDISERRRLGEPDAIGLQGPRFCRVAGRGRVPRAVRHTLFIAAALALLLAVAHAAPDYLPSAALLVNAAGIEGWPHALGSWKATPFRSEACIVPSRHGDLRARLYAPERRPDRVFLMAPGVHASGLEEPRLVDFAGHLASRDFAVLTEELPDLRRYRITPRTTDMIEDAASWLAASNGLAKDGRVGIIGISFAGGLGIVAAGRPALRDRVAFVISLGGHGDLSRTLCSTGLGGWNRKCPSRPPQS